MRERFLSIDWKNREACKKLQAFLLPLTSLLFESIENIIEVGVKLLGDCFQLVFCLKSIEDIEDRFSVFL